MWRLPRPVSEKTEGREFSDELDTNRQDSPADNGDANGEPFSILLLGWGANKSQTQFTATPVLAPTTAMVKIAGAVITAAAPPNNPIPRAVAPAMKAPA